MGLGRPLKASEGHGHLERDTPDEGRKGSEPGNDVWDGLPYFYNLFPLLLKFLLL